MTGRLHSLGRQVAFARQVPPRRLLRRAALLLRRRAEARLRPALRPGCFAISADPPLPIFPPRSGMIGFEPLRLRFIGREIVMGEAIDWKAPNAEPRDQLWRMNLHYMEYLEEVPDSAFVGLIEAWIAANPPYRNGATHDSWNAYSLSLRVVVWMQQIAIRRERLASDFIGLAARSIAGQIAYLERHLESDIGGNHLIKNIKALAWASAFFEGPEARSRRRKAVRLLDREVGSQILPDGMHYELSPSYHCQVFADLVEIRAALGEDPIGGRLDDALNRAAQVIADLAHPDGKAAQFGDSGLSMAYMPSICLAAFRSVGGELPMPRPVFQLAQAGYFGTRQDDDYLVFDAGPIAAVDLPAHGHGDMFSFEWSLGGERVIVDQGVFEYVAGPKRAAARACASHNSVCIQGADQADFFGAFRAGRRARVRIIEHEESGTGFTLAAEHDGYIGLPDRVRHQRRVHASPKHIRIEDRLEGRRTAPAQAALLLGPAIRAERLSATKLRLVGRNVSASVSGSHEIAIEPALWWPDMGVEKPTSRLVMRLPAGDNQSWLELAGSGER